MSPAKKKAPAKRKAPRKKTGFTPEQAKRARSAFQRFTARKSTSSIMAINIPDAWGYVGDAHELLYTSKKGKAKNPELYGHPFKAGASMYVSSDGRYVLIKAKWNERGIIG